MVSSLDFGIYALWSFYGAIAFSLLAVLGFIFKWGFRFRFVGVTGFMGVLTIGLFALSLGLFQRVEIPNAVRFNLVYDTGADKAVIAVPLEITPTQLEATLQQAALDLFSYGRTARDSNAKLTIRARVQVHQDNVTIPLYLGEVQRSLTSREDDNIQVTIFEDRFDRLRALI